MASPSRCPSAGARRNPGFASPAAYFSALDRFLSTSDDRITGEEISPMISRAESWRLLARRRRPTLQLQPTLPIQPAEFRAAKLVHFDLLFPWIVHLVLSRMLP